MSGAKTQAEQLLSEIKADSERRRAAAQREVAELTRQQDSVASHLAQVRQLLVGQLTSSALISQRPHPRSAGLPP